MRYRIEYKEEAKEGMRLLKKSGDKQAMRKLDILIEELTLHPMTGTGKPERLTANLTGKWSRRITEKHRLVYEIFEEIVTVEVIQVYGHYGDK